MSRPRPKHRTNRRPPGRPRGARSHVPKRGPTDPPRPPGRPSTLPDRPDTPAKAILQAMGGVPRAQARLVLAGAAYTKAALYQWLRHGYIPERPLKMCLAICNDGDLKLPEGIEEWNAHYGEPDPMLEHAPTTRDYL